MGFSNEKGLWFAASIAIFLLGQFLTAILHLAGTVHSPWATAMIPTFFSILIQFTWLLTYTADVWTGNYTGCIEYFGTTFAVLVIWLLYVCEVWFVVILAVYLDVHGLALWIVYIAPCVAAGIATFAIFAYILYDGVIEQCRSWRLLKSRREHSPALSYVEMGDDSVSTFSLYSQSVQPSQGHSDVML